MAIASGHRASAASRLRRGGALVLALVVGGAAWAQLSAPASTQRPAASPAPSSLIVALSDNHDWAKLTPGQQAVLAPLQREWAGIEVSRRAKWLEIANRYPSLAPAEQQRITARMAEWANLTPAERGRARMQFQESRQFPATDRQAQWDAYRALPEETRKELAQRAKPATPARPDARAAAPATPASGAVVVGKRNDTPTPKATPSRPVTPTVVQAKPGATTTLVTRAAAPPLHQQPGLPKIAATPGFVNPSTLLPKRGPQGAAVQSAAAAGSDASP